VTPQTPRSPGGSRPRPLILVVDDNVDVREMYCSYLEFVGFRCHEAVNGEDALAQVSEEPPALILMDATMPLMDGWEATRRLKQDSLMKHVPLIMFTAHAFPEHRERAEALGVEGFLSKPVLPDDLAREVRRILKLPPTFGER
jgi:two-component system, cell cycle response regulator DivK